MVAIAAAGHSGHEHSGRDLHGLDYTLADKDMSGHPTVIQWIAAAIEEALERGARPAPK